MRRYIVLLLITGTVWAQTGLDKLVLKDGTEYLGEYSKTEKNIIYFKPQDALSTQPVSVKLIQELKLKDANESWILMDGMIPGTNNYSDQCGAFAMLDGADTNLDTPRHHGVYYAGANSNNGWARFIYQVHRIIKNDDSAQELAAGSRTWKVGWYPQNGGGSNKPFRILILLVVGNVHLHTRPSLFLILLLSFLQLPQMKN